jgi:hypothetical protein
MSDEPTLHSRWRLILQIEMSLIVFGALLLIIISANITSSYMVMVTLTYMSDFSVHVFFQWTYIDSAYFEKKITLQSSAQKLVIRLSIFIN